MGSCRGKDMKRLAVLGMIVLCLCGFDGGCGDVKERKRLYQVEYIVRGNGYADVEYLDIDGKHTENVKLPWFKYFIAKSEDYLYLKASNFDTDGSNELKPSIVVYLNDQYIEAVECYSPPYECDMDIKYQLP